MLKVAVVGTGLIATRKHIPAWKKNSGLAKLVALCDVNAEAGEKVRKEFDVPKAYTDLGELLATEKPDIIDICTPPKTHAPLAIQAVEAGCACADREADGGDGGGVRQGDPGRRAGGSIRLCRALGPVLPQLHAGDRTGP